MKIVIFQDDFPPESKGGAGMIAGQFALALHLRGEKVSVIAATQHKENSGLQMWNGIPVYRIYSAYHERWRAWRSLYNPVVVSKVKRLLRDLKPDIVHAHNVHSHLSYASLVAAKQEGAKVVLTAHDAMLVRYGKLPMQGDASAWRDLREQRWRYNPLRNFCIRKVLKYVDTIFVVSESLRLALEHSGIPRTVTIHNGIDASLWGASPSSVAQFVAGHALEGKKVVLFGGRISAAKGGDALLAAMPYVVKACPEAVLAIAGRTNAYVEKLRHKAKDLGLEGALVSLGWLSGGELHCAYGSAQVVVAPSLYLDPLPTVVLEAMASRKPVVASRYGGLPEMVVNGQTGYIVDPNNKEELASRITELLVNESKAHSMGEAGYERVRKEFSLARQMEETLFWYAK